MGQLGLIRISTKQQLKNAQAERKKLLKILAKLDKEIAKLETIGDEK